ncbi:MAG TPA: hypothetical protein VG759_19580 [Candidatus Angelobacter sp.]|jgi:DNA-directed RNA polymerase specialized sigma24 family protein|nr:hypothetical protein [Candidatus Angelobacter sp.]
MGAKALTNQETETDREHFSRLLARLSPQRERAWQEYASLRKKLVMFFEPRADAEEMAEDVLDRIARKDGSYSIINVAEFAFGVARNLRKEMYRRDSARVSATDDSSFPVEPSGPESGLIASIDNEKKRRCFSICIQQLSAEERRLILEYFPDDEEPPDERRQRLAAELKISSGALRTRMTRLRERLELCCGRCLSGKHQSGRHQGSDQ